MRQVWAADRGGHGLGLGALVGSQRLVGARARRLQPGHIAAPEGGVEQAGERGRGGVDGSEVADRAALVAGVVRLESTEDW